MNKSKVIKIKKGIILCEVPNIEIELQFGLGRKLYLRSAYKLLNGHRTNIDIELIGPSSPDIVEEIVSYA